ncbi:ECA polysaccharide chain length modulation protein [Edwardsiella ictaluri]|uniref:ECA polysaccharide chain length modulation protein n=1 Tax=Edwardsiella ictaluri TaxID=67780 RepID=A0ABY8GJT1_EDWIC|nr:ECA polysaccharide chain length modulation protein [Edwardsiella ictaluri]ARD39938.1 polysaccharide chain length modulation protein [Edwardsiella ictaluri]ELV7527109.1 ECA polysaccharide chain length modulation protein [Edwardsiella ictaluri]QPW25486.1 ECA polysaccharide chain length modulation protein [Edwardsiella ictaluri]WFN97765.1 ECA polysaccharide chain length modulation protein [Edwardsiella ictaluri]
MVSQNPMPVENELDVRGLCRALWHGKPWVVGTAALFAALALGVSLLMPQKWSAAAITASPGVNRLGSYYSQQQFLRNLAQLSAPSGAAAQGSIADEAYAEFTTQLASYDTRREFWLRSPYYQRHKEGSAQADAALLDELINQIVFTPGEATKHSDDSIRLTADGAAQANQLLRQYVAFAAHRASANLNASLQGAWAARSTFLKAQVKRQEAVAQAIYQRELNGLEQGLKIAAQQGITRSMATTAQADLPDAELFMLGQPMLRARLEALRAVGPSYDIDYDRNRAMLTTLSVGPVLDAAFQPYRYLRTPEEPVKRDSPRRLFMMVMWGAIGALLGAGIALSRRARI